MGAYEGNWTKAVLSVFENTQTIMVEHQLGKREKLEKITKNHKFIKFEPCMLSNISGKEIEFFEMETGSLYFSENSNAPRKVTKYTSKTLDEICPESQNIFLKIDAQGSELDILNGAQKVLKNFSLIQLEAAIAKYNEGAQSIADALNYMQNKNFRVIDIFGHTRIKNNLIQIDLLFVPENSNLICDFFEF